MISDSLRIAGAQMAPVGLDRAGTLVKVIAVVLGIIERPLDRGGHSVYDSVVTIDSSGNVSRGQRH
jgi:hypothetical protein